MTGPIRPQAASGPTTPLGQQFNALVEALKALTGTQKPAPPPNAAMVDPRVAAVVPRPFLDSLFQLSGTPSGGVTSLPDPDGSRTTTAGYYSPTRDEMAMTPLGLRVPRSLPSLDPDSTRRFTRVPPPDYAMAHEAGHRMYEKETAPYAQRDWYGDSEAFARAVASGVNAIRATANLPLPAARAGLASWGAKSDGADPGLVNWLLSQPIFANHPVAQYNRMVRPQSDATAAPQAPSSPANTMYPSDGTSTMQQILAQALLAANKKRQAGR